MGLIQADSAGKMVLSQGGAKFNPQNTYAGELVLNRGSKIEIKSHKTPLSIAELQVLSDDPNASPISEASTATEPNRQKRYRLELVSSAPIAACANLSGQITVIGKTMQQVTPPGRHQHRNVLRTYIRPVRKYLRWKAQNPLTGEQSDKFIFSNKQLTDADIQTLKNIHTTALYGGLGNTTTIQVSNTTTILPIEPVGVVVLGIDGLRQDVLYESGEQQVNPQGTLSPYYVGPTQLKGLCDVLGGKYTSGWLSSSCDPAGWENRHIKLPNVTAIFPSITLASWASIFTGQQAGGTGILGNEFFDRAEGKMITFSDGAFKMMSIFDRFPLGSGKKPGNGAADKTLSPGVQTVYEAIKAIRSDLKSTAIMHNYSRGADKWLYQEWLINKLRFARNGLVGDEQDIAGLMDSSPTDDTVSYIGSLAGAQEKFPALLAVYFAGLDHWAHDEGMDTYVQFFKDNSDKGVEKIVKALKDADEFENKIFIITADHGHTAMPTDLKYKDEDDAGNVQYKDAEMSCKLKLDFVNPEFPDFITSAQNAEKANNNLHIWELGEVMRQTGFLKGAEGLDFAVMAPQEIASLYAQFSYGAKADTTTANIIAALNGPMAHIYVKNRANNSWSSPRLVEDIGYVAELLRLTISTNKTPSNLSSLFPVGMFEKAVPISAGLKRLINSVDMILVRRGNSYEVFQGIRPDSSDIISTPLDSHPELNTSKYVKAAMRIKGMHHSERSGDIVLIFKSDTVDVSENRYTSGVSCKSWHGSLNPSDSYVPLILSYPGGNKFEVDKIMQSISACPNGQCEGNWNVTDIIKEIINRQYGSQ